MQTKVESQERLDAKESETFKKRYVKLKEWYQERDLMLSDNPSEEDLMWNYGQRAQEADCFDDLQWFIDCEHEIVEEQVMRSMGVPSNSELEVGLGYVITVPSILRRGAWSVEQQQFYNALHPETSLEELEQQAHVAKVDFGEFINQGKVTGEIQETTQPSDIVNSQTGEVEQVPAGRLYYDADRTKIIHPIATVPKFPRGRYDVREISTQFFKDYQRQADEPIAQPELDDQPYLAALLNFPGRPYFK